MARLKRGVSESDAPIRQESAPGATEVAIVAQVAPKPDLVMQGDPDAQLQFAMKAANALMKVAKPINIQGKEYLPFGSWQILGRFFGSTVGVEWTKNLTENGKLMGYEARAIVYRDGVVISSAEASCMTTERNWRNRDEYAVKSMAQTRACAKALRNAFGWVAELANYQSTPAEEMMTEHQEEKVNYVVARKSAIREYEYPEYNETNDAHGLDEPKAEPVGRAKLEIANLLKKNHGYTVMGKDKEQIAAKVLLLTGLTLEEKNYTDIIQRLKTPDEIFDEQLDS